MYSFVICVKPKSINSWGSASMLKKQKYRDKIEDAFRDAYLIDIPVEAELYGLVYHFYQEDHNIGIDADNLSKPIWDCLKGILFDDDRQVKFQIAGSFDLSKNDFTAFSSSGLPGRIIDKLSEAFKMEKHILYVECGTFTVDIVRLNLEKNEY